MPDTIIPNGHDTTRQAEANRKNAQLSTGPRTEAGKARSAQNSLQHGLTARAIVLPTEDATAYQLHVQEFFDEYQPKGATERQLVQAIADAAWRLNRIPALENALFANQETDLAVQVRALSTLSMHAHRLTRDFERTLEQLRALQRERRRTEEDQMKKAADLFEMDKDKGVPFDPAENGFVFSTREVETHIHRRDRAKKAYDAAIERQWAADHPEEEEEEE